MPNIAYIAAACGASFIVLGLALSRPNPPRPQPIVESKYVASLQERWGDVDKDSPPPIRIVKTIRITKEPVETVEVKEIEPPVQVVEKPQPRQVVRRDICSVHRMRKVMVGKYKWRCRR